VGFIEKVTLWVVHGGLHREGFSMDGRCDEKPLVRRDDFCSAASWHPSSRLYSH